jgi:hypothetical protein
MRIPVSLCVAGLLCACASAGGGDGGAVSNIVASVTDALAPGAQPNHQGEIDDDKCRDLGHEPNTWGYGNCRLELELRRDPIAELISRN